MTTANLPLQPPREPALDACCGSGCTPCVFDLYEEAKARYEAALAASEDKDRPAACGGGTGAA